MSFKKVVVIGGGVLGSQIAYQTAYKGFDVTIWLRSRESVQRAQHKIDLLYAQYAESLAQMDTPEGKHPSVWCRGLADPETFDYRTCMAANEAAHSGLKMELDLEKALKGADLVIESMAEDPEAKTAFYKKAAKLLPDNTVLVTNSSTMLPSRFAESTGRPEKYLALHFANNISFGNTAEIMGHAGTSRKYYDQVVAFAEEIGMVPLCLYKEQPGYLLNSMLMPFLGSALRLWAENVADPETIDFTWKSATGAATGPFEILDLVGINTSYNILKMKRGADDITTPNGKIIAKLKERMDAGKLGVSTGEGFYKYE